jgi:hypothetical protein
MITHLFKGTGLVLVNASDSSLRQLETPYLQKILINHELISKGILQTQTRLGPWKKHLAENPFDVRRAYIGAGVAKKLVDTTLLGRPAKGRQYHFGNVRPQTPANPPHQIFVNTQQNQ